MPSLSAFFPDLLGDNADRDQHVRVDLDLCGRNDQMQVGDHHVLDELGLGMRNQIAAESVELEATFVAAREQREAWLRTRNG